ncbi:MAG TPA: glycosyltransferase [Gemmatimonadales bacterium]
MTTPSLSVVMRSKNSDWVIHQALAALFSQSITDFELILLDSGSSDRTLEIVGHYPHRLLRVAPEEYVPGPVLNQGFTAARGEIVVLLNSDGVLLAPDALERLVAPFDDPAVCATVARQLPRPEADAWVRREYAVSFPEAGATPPWITLSAVTAAIRRSAWERHRFYDSAWGSEDTEWGLWAKRQGMEIRYVPEALVMHSHNYTLRQLYGRRFIEGEADAFLYAKPAGLPGTLARVAWWSLRDALACLRTGTWSDLPRIPARQVVYHWGWLRGHRHGTARRLRGNRDIRLGQQTVLSRHESVQAG